MIIEINKSTTSSYGKYFLAFEAPRKNNPEVTVEPEDDETDIVPETDDITPEEDDVTPEVDDVEPEMDDVTPETDDVEPESDDVTPEPDDVEVEPATDDMDVVPEEDDVTPEVDDVEPEMDDVTPETDDVEPESDDNFNNQNADTQPETSDDNADDVQPDTDFNNQDDDGDVQPATDDGSQSDDNQNSKGPGLEYDSTRKYNLFKEYMSLYNALDNYVSKLEDSISDNLPMNQVIKVAVNKLREIKDLTYDFMMIKFELSSYVQSLLFYQNLIVSVQLVFNLIKKAKEKDNKK
jgi:chitinase